MKFSIRASQDFEGREITSIFRKECGDFGAQPVAEGELVALLPQLLQDPKTWEKPSLEMGQLLWTLLCSLPGLAEFQMDPSRRIINPRWNK